jgi:RNA polymerase sigma-70 factor (ECF subfamily)
MNLHEPKELQGIIKQCINKDKRAQQALFSYCYSFALSICSRYCSDSEEAKEVLSDGLLKVFSQLHRYSPELSFGGWERRIMVNTAIDHYRKNKKYHETQLEVSHVKEMAAAEETVSMLESEDILKLVQKLPPAYGMVFTLFVVEEFTHKEIAEKLGITAGTSKSNLSKKIKIATLNH